MKDINELYIHSFIKNFFEGWEGQGASLLDLGCGSQPYKKYYNTVVSSVVTFDIEARIDHLMVIGDAHKLPFESELFDVLICSEVIEHLVDPEIAFSEMLRVLKPNGVMLLTWPFIYSLHEIPNDYSRITEFLMSRWVGKHNSVSIRMERRGDVFFVLNTILSGYAMSFLLGIERAPIVGKILLPIIRLLNFGFKLGYLLHFKLAGSSSRFLIEAPGDKLSGAIGRLSLYTLGYDFVIKKNE